MLFLVGPTHNFMQGSSCNWLFWTRGILAVLLATMLVSIAIPSAGRIVIDPSNPARPHVVWGFREYFPSVALSLFSLGCIFVGMWKGWAFEIVGWAILGAFILASGMG